MVCMLMTLKGEFKKIEDILNTEKLTYHERLEKITDITSQAIEMADEAIEVENPRPKGIVIIKPLKKETLDDLMLNQHKIK